MARFHPEEDGRLNAFLDWHEEWVGFEITRARRGSTSNGSAHEPRTGGEYAVRGSSSRYPVVLLEAENELPGGDPDYQLQRQMQVSPGCCSTSCRTLNHKLCALCCCTGVAFTTAGCLHDQCLNEACPLCS
jgi:hypothetical protein